MGGIHGVLHVRIGGMEEMDTSSRLGSSERKIRYIATIEMFDQIMLPLMSICQTNTTDRPLGFFGVFEM